MTSKVINGRYAHKESYMQNMYYATHDCILNCDLGLEAFLA